MGIMKVCSKANWRYPFSHYTIDGCVFSYNVAMMFQSVVYSMIINEYDPRQRYVEVLIRLCDSDDYFLGVHQLSGAA